MKKGVLWRGKKNEIKKVEKKKICNQERKRRKRGESM